MWFAGGVSGMGKDQVTDRQPVQATQIGHN